MQGLYSRQEAIKLNIPHTVAVIGCGGTGANTAILLAMSGVRELYLFDSDAIEESNRARLPYPPSSVGLNKAEALKKYINEIRPQCKIETYPHFDNGNFYHLEIINIADRVVEASDNPGTRDVLRCLSRYQAHPVCVHYDGVEVEVYFLRSEEIFDTLSESDANTPEVGGYTITPSWVVPAVYASLKAVHLICREDGKEIIGNMAEVDVLRRG